MIKPNRKTLQSLATLLVSFVAGTLPVYADAVLTFDRETTGNLRPERQRRGESDGNNDAQQPAPVRADPKQTVTVLLKGTRARVEFRPIGAKPETAPSAVLLYDGMAQKVYTLNPVAKTYFVQSYKEAIDGERRVDALPDGDRGSRMTFAGTVELKAARADNAFVSKEILGAQTRQYIVSGNVEMTFNLPENAPAQNPPAIYVPQGNAGGFPSGGNPGSGNFPPGGRMRGGFAPPSLAVDGEVWSTDGAALFTAGHDTPVVAIYRLMLPDNAGAFGGPLTKPLVTRLKNMKSLPGESTVSLRMSSRFRSSENGEDMPAADPLSTHLTMKTIITDATIEDALFAIPTDFTLAEPPSAGFGRPGGRGGWGNGGGDRRPGGNRNNE